jgi:hypothetical protein
MPQANGRVDQGSCRLCITCVACLLLLLATGCSDVSPGWGNDTQQPEPRPAGPPAGRLIAQSSDEADGSTAQTADAAPAPPQKPDAPRPSQSAAQPAPSRSPVQVYQLVLLSEAGPAEAPSGLKHVRLMQARARDVANVLKILYLPSGPTGTDHRYTLVYPTALEHRLADEAARLLDVQTDEEEAGAPPGDTSAEWWRWGVSQTFRVLDDMSIAEDRVRLIAGTLATAATSAQLSTLQRWAAGMLAGELLAHRVYDYAGADSVYRLIEAIAEPGSYEQMALLYARGRAFQQDGRRAQARPAFETIVGQFSAMRGSEVFERARETLASWDRRR